MKNCQSEDTCRGSRHLRICGQTVCGRGFMKMMGIGRGRFHVLGKAVRDGSEYCPYDGRYGPKCPKPPSEKWFKVHGYLMEIYTNVAEPIPDGLNSNKRPRQGRLRFDDPNMNRGNIKHLPARSISEYHKQCQAAVGDSSISRKLFCAVPCLQHVFILFLVLGK